MLLAATTTLAMANSSSNNDVDNTHNHQQADVGTTTTTDDSNEIENGNATSGRSVGLQIIGAGHGRTGTDSLRRALNQLPGYGITYHMIEVLGVPGDNMSLGNAYSKGDVDEWIKIAENDLIVDSEGLPTFEPYDWNTFFDNNKVYKSGVDQPIRLFVEELVKYYPNSKVILTIRNPNGWYKSITKTFCRYIAENSMDEGSWDEWFYWYRGTSYYKWFGGDFEQRVRLMNKALELRERRILRGQYLKTFTMARVCQDRNYALRYYEVWNNYVKSVVPSDRLLIIDLDNDQEVDGVDVTNEKKTQKLLEFLGDIPDDIAQNFVYPHTNTRQHFEETAIYFKQVTAILTLVVPPIVILMLVMVLLKYCCRRRQKLKEEKID